MITKYDQFSTEKEIKDDNLINGYHLFLSKVDMIFFIEPTICNKVTVNHNINLLQLELIDAALYILPLSLHFTEKDRAYFLDTYRAPIGAVL